MANATIIGEVTSLGLQFAERMSGFIAGGDAQGYNDAARRGRETGASFELLATITADDLNLFLRERSHAAKLTGTVNAPSLSPQAMEIMDGSFNLFVDDPTNVNVRKLVYEMRLIGSNGRQLFVSGFKFARDDPGMDAWTDTTTLFVTVYEGGKPAEGAGGKVVARGIITISVADFAKELTTIRILNSSGPIETIEAIVRFGSFFAGNMFELYGGVFKRPNIFNPDARARQKRPLKVTAPEVYTFSTLDNLNLRLTRYRGGEKGPVLLAHGLGVSSRIFAIDTIETTMLEYLFGNGYDVWLLDYRSSIDLPYATQAYSADDVAKKDYPAAVEFVRRQSGAETVQAVVHCFGATTFVMSMLAGLSGVRSAVVSQIATHLRVPTVTKLKALFHVPDMLAAIGIKTLTAYVDTHASLTARLADTLLRLYPIHDGPADDSVVSRRISFLYGQLYQIEQLNQATYDALHELFGVADIKTFQHMTTMVRAQKVVNFDGQDEYLAEAGGSLPLARLAIPTLFIHGELNQCWLPQSTEITYELLRQHNDPAMYDRKLIPGYGHIDCIFGKDASRDVYPHILSHLEKTALA